VLSLQDTQAHPEAWEEGQVMRSEKDPVQASVLLTAPLDINNLEILLFLSPL
jgi:hypothetical protein